MALIASGCLRAQTYEYALSVFRWWMRADPDLLAIGVEKSSTLFIVALTVATGLQAKVPH